MYDDLPFFAYQPYPLIMSGISFIGTTVAFVAAFLAWRLVFRMARQLDAMRFVLKMQQHNYEESVRAIIAHYSGEPPPPEEAPKVN